MAVRAGSAAMTPAPGVVGKPSQRDRHALVALAFLLWGCASGSAGAPRGFVHPGALNAYQDLDFVKEKIRTGQQPWAGELDRLTRARDDRDDAHRSPHGATTINSNADDATVSRDDASGAYAQALIWYYSGDEQYGRRAIAILNSWANLKAFTGGNDQERLQAGWVGAVFANAAEIMRLDPGWSPADIAKLQAMFKRVFYPLLNTASPGNGNVDLTQIDAMMAIAVFNDDRTEFDLGLRRLRARVPAYIYLSPGPVPPIDGDHGNVDEFWSHPARWVDGVMQETCRDNGHHAQFGLGSALHAAETAWNQGVDVYTEMGPRFTAALELLATQLLTGSMQGTCQADRATDDLYDTWEVGYHHYHDRKGLALPQTGLLIRTKIRPKAPRAVWNLAWETLTHARE